MTKSELYANIAAASDVPKKQVIAVLEALAAEIKASLGSKGAGVIAIPGLVKIEKKKVPARKAQTGVPNLFKPGELMDRPAKPAYRKVRLRCRSSSGKWQSSGSPPMTKKNIVQAISEELGLTHQETRQIVQKTLDAIVNTLVGEGRVDFATSAL